MKASRKRFSFFLLITQLFAALVLVQPARGDLFTEYLSGREIWAMVYDANRGLIWFGTQTRGVISFDGTRFRQYDVTNSGLPDNFVRALALDHRGMLWVGTNRHGLIRLNVEANTWECHIDSSNGFTHNRISAIAVDAGSIWAGTFGGGVVRLSLDCLLLDTLTVRNSAGKLPSNFIYSLASDSSGNLWIGSSLGLSLFDMEARWGEPWMIGSTFSLLVERENAVWVGTASSGTSSGIFKLVKNQASWQLLPIASPCARPSARRLPSCSRARRRA